MVSAGTSMIGSIFGDRYRIDGLIGRGGMATVYRAQDESLDRAVALKVLTMVGGSSEDSDSADRARVRSEVRLLASLSHPSLVTLFDAAVLANDTGDVDQMCLVMELVDGPDLGERIAAGVLAPRDVAHLAADIAEALHIVHSSGVVHRDIKPGNVLLAPSGLPDRNFHAKLADFGIASLVDSTRITATGTLIGTAAFLSPEQALGQAAAPTTDIYSLGLVLLEALTGRREFGGSMVETVSARLNRDPYVPATLGGSWIALLTAMTARDPAGRPTAIEVAVAARRILVESEQEIAAGLAATAVLDSPTLVATAVLNASAVPDAVTQRLSDVAERAPTAGDNTASERGRPVEKTRKRAVRVAVAAVLIFLGIVLAMVIVPQLLPSSPESPTTQQLPVNEGQLGFHLQQLLESVTP